MSFFRSELSANLKALLLAVLFIATANTAAESAEGKAPFAKPRLIEFYASWCVPCQRMQASIDRARTQYGSELDFISYNVDDPAAQEAIKQYEVCPIPTVVFVNEKNQVTDYAIGCTQEKVLEKKIEAMLNASFAGYKASNVDAFKTETQSGT